jgi:hypothetical protein
VVDLGHPASLRRSFFARGPVVEDGGFGALRARVVGSPARNGQQPETRSHPRLGTGRAWSTALRGSDRDRASTQCTSSISLLLLNQARHFGASTRLRNKPIPSVVTCERFEARGIEQFRGSYTVETD